MSREHVFTAEIWEHSPDGPGSWHFLTLPGDVAEEVRLESGPPAGFGSVRVEVTIGSTTWRTSLFPDAESGSFVLPVKKQVRQVEGLEAGDGCEVRISVDPADPRRPGSTLSAAPSPAEPGAGSRAARRRRR